MSGLQAPAIRRPCSMVRRIKAMSSRAASASMAASIMVQCTLKYKVHCGNEAVKGDGDVARMREAKCGEEVRDSARCPRLTRATGQLLRQERGNGGARLADGEHAVEVPVRARQLRGFHLVAAGRDLVRGVLDQRRREHEV